MKEITYTDAIELMAFGGTDVDIYVSIRADTYTIPALRALAAEGASFYINAEILDPPEAHPDPTKEEPTPEPEKPKKPSTKFDHGKVAALRKAGWTIAEIADEMGVNQKKIQNSLYRHSEKEMEVTA